MGREYRAPSRRSERPPPYVPAGKNGDGIAAAWCYLAETMSGSTGEAVFRWTSPRCVACGAEAVRAIREGGSSCDRCGCAFDERPPRSYADLEGLTASHLARHWRPRKRRDSQLAWPGLIVVAALAAMVIAGVAAELS